jgi:hypothetical protein
MFIDGKPTDGDIAFIAYTRETFSASEIWTDFYSRAIQDKPFFTFYCLLVGLILLVLIAVLVWRPKPPIPPPGGEVNPSQDDNGGKR